RGDRGLRHRRGQEVLPRCAGKVATRVTRRDQRSRPNSDALLTTRCAPLITLAHMELTFSLNPDVATPTGFSDVYMRDTRCEIRESTPGCPSRAERTGRQLHP